MLRATLKSLAARKLRLGLSAFAVILGVAFVAGSYIFTDTLNRTFDELFGGLNADVVVRPEVGGDASVNLAYGAGTTTTIPAELVDTVAAVEGVERADGNVENNSVFVLDDDGRVIGGLGGPGVAVSWNDAPAAGDRQIVEIVEGEPPGPGQVALDDETVDGAGFEIGDRIDFVTSGDTPRISAELSGVMRFNGGASLAGTSLSAFDERDAQEYFLGGEDAYSTISVAAADGVDAEDLADTVTAALPDGLEAVPGAEVDDEAVSAIESGLGFFNTFLLVFAGIALFVGTFIILNTFSILVAQRSQEMALLRALGASRRQVTRSVLLEALLVGVVGATIGIALGAGVALLLKLVFASFGLDIGGTLTLLPRTVIICYAVGILVTMVAAYVPARRAGRVSPVAAMRADAAIGQRARRRGEVVGAVLTALGTAGVILGLTGDVGNALWLVGAGVLAVFVGVALLAPLISRPIIAVVAGWYPRVFGAVGRLARENALRNPRRTASTASALMIGLALMSTIAVVGASANASVERALDDGMDAEFVVSNAIGQPFSPTIPEQAEQVDGVASVVAVRGAPAQIDGSFAFVQAFDVAAMAESTDIEITAGELDPGDDGMLYPAQAATTAGLSVGDEVTVTLPGGDQTATITGLYADNPVIGNSQVVSDAFLDRAGMPPAVLMAYVNTEPGADLSAIQTELDEIAGEIPTVTVQDQQAFKDQQRDAVNQLLYIVYALLGLAILIAVLGIVNTLALSVIERTREVGLLRAVGMSRRQLRRTIRLESVVIAVLGAVLGIGLGLIFGVSLQRVAADDGLEVLAVPWVAIALFVVLSVAVGVLAAVWPARRAARLDVLRAITTE